MCLQFSLYEKTRATHGTFFATHSTYIYINANTSISNDCFSVYKSHDTPQNFTDARDICVKWGGYLFAPKSEREFDDLP